MSKYIEDVQGRIESNPINETNTNYGYIPPNKEGKINADDYNINTQYMYNNQPVSDIDIEVYSSYRSKVEELRKRTESSYEALESCLVPVEIPGMSFQPYEFTAVETEDGEMIEEKVKSFTYFFQDHLSPISVESQEYVFRTNKVKFIDDRHRRLIYDRTIHIMSLKEDEDNKITFKEVLLRTFFKYIDNQYFSHVCIPDIGIVSVNTIISAIMDDITNNRYEVTMITEDGSEKKLESVMDFNLVMKSGQDIDTTIPSTLFNLYNLGWVEPSVIFLNGLIIPWTNITLSVDNIDTFVIVGNLSEEVTKILDDTKEIEMDYIHIPFKVIYSRNHPTDMYYYKDYAKSTAFYKDYCSPIFVINKNFCSVYFTGDNQYDFKRVTITQNNLDRIICVDPNIKFAEFTIGEDNEGLKDVAIEFTKSFRTFCDNDYRCKLKRFNFIGFENSRYWEDAANRGTLKNDDFDVSWHPFNIMDIRFKKLFNRERRFKVFYNTKVLYDQDNILRIKNHSYLADEYEKYIQDLTANIEVYMNEIYTLAKKDIGTYIATSGKMAGYKYNYVTPYECFMLYNAIRKANNESTISFDDFRKINTSGSKTDVKKYKYYTNEDLAVNSDGNCVWVIPVEKGLNPAIEIRRTSDGELMLADIKYNQSDNNLIITMSNQGNNIPANTYRACVYFSDIVLSNTVDLVPINGIAEYDFTSSEIKNTFDSTVTLYDNTTQCVVIADVHPVSDNTYKALFHIDKTIPRLKYSLAINTKEVDFDSKLNYLNGGFIAVPKDDESKFLSMVKEDLIYSDIKEEIFNPDIINYFKMIISKTNGYITDMLVPIDNEVRTDSKPESNSFKIHEGDNKGKVIPFAPTMNEFGMVQEYDDVIYDRLKLRFEMCYLNNMEEGSTPIDEFIYYFDNTDGVRNYNTYPIMIPEIADNRLTANMLNSIAKNIFKIDPNKVYDTIERLNYSADYLIPPNFDPNVDRDKFIITADQESYDREGYDYRSDPKFYYNFGYEEINNSHHKLSSEWGLRRNLPEMFKWTLSKDEYSLDSMNLLDEVFDFTYDFTKTYEENLRNGVNYIIGYDADKLEQTIKRSIVSLTKTGTELRNHMKKTECRKTVTLDDYKVITFLKYKNQKVIVDNIKITVELNPNTSGIESLVPSKVYQTVDGVKYDFDNANMKHRSQDNYTVKKTANSFINIDKSITQTFDSVLFNRTTDMLEYYNQDELVLTIQVDEVIDKSRLQMSRWNISNQDNFVMIFKNRELYDKYNTIEYTDIDFSVEMDESLLRSSDTFEFVFFLNANNTVMKKICDVPDDAKVKLPGSYYSKDSRTIRTDMNNIKMDKGLYSVITDTVTLNSAVSCNTSILDAENVQLLVNTMPKSSSDSWTPESYENTTYELDYNVKSYESTTEVYSVDNSRRFIHRLKNDTKLNGLYRMTKQGGGEYFLEYDGKVPGDSSIRTLNTPYTLYLSSKRQFRYKHIDIEEAFSAGYICVLNTNEYIEPVPEGSNVEKTYVYKTEMDDFKFCLDNSHVMVFRNGLLLPNTYYYLHSVVNTPIPDTGIVFNVPLAVGDRIDIFYVTNSLKHIETDYYDEKTKERYINNGEIRIADNKSTEYRVMGEEVSVHYRTNYIKMRSPLYAISSKHSTFVFLNGKKVRLDELEDISDTIMSINTDYTGDMANAIRLDVLNHLDTQDIIEQLYINDGLAHTRYNPPVSTQFATVTEPTSSKKIGNNTLLISNIPLSDLESYAKRTLLDEMLNDLSDKNLNKLFYDYTTGRGPTTPMYPDRMNDPDFIKKEDVMTFILNKYYKK